MRVATLVRFLFLTALACIAFSGLGARAGGSGTTGGPPSMSPPVLVYVEHGAGEMTVGWQPYPNATQYTILRSTTGSSGSFSAVFTGSAFPSDNSGDLYYYDSGAGGGSQVYYYEITVTLPSGTNNPGPSNIVSAGGVVVDPRGSFFAAPGNGVVTLARFSFSRLPRLGRQCVLSSNGR